ncbi:MAG TPA: P1 family peptidase [Gemmatimonadaceae bacterium]|nr:P1 family peptidase [Gemmatimonadaceae bacterium]
MTLPTLHRRSARVTIALAIGLAVASPDSASLHAQERPRARDLGIVVGTYAPGPLNAITDVPGVRVGHATVMRGDSVRTGVTMIFPHAGNPFESRVPAAAVVGNGFGKFVGSTQLAELGELETPIALTCTLCVWRVAEGMAKWMLAQPRMERVRSINPVVGETNDGWALNAIRTMPVTDADVVQALTSASAGPVAEGAVGAGTGTVAFEWKGGIGTSSRVVPRGGWTVGVLVQSNFGDWGDLLVQGVPVGRELGRGGVKPNQGKAASGSIVVVIATDAPLSDRSLRRLAARALLGIGRTGGYASNGSGDYAIAFSTHPSVRRAHVAGSSGTPPDSIMSVELGNEVAGRLFEPVVDATVEAIYNSLFRATTQQGAFSRVEALPIDEVRAILARYNIGSRR